MRSSLVVALGEGVAAENESIVALNILKCLALACCFHAYFSDIHLICIHTSFNSGFLSFFSLFSSFIHSPPTSASTPPADAYCQILKNFQLKQLAPEFGQKKRVQNSCLAVFFFISVAEGGR